MDCEEGWVISASELYQCFRNISMKIIYDDIGKKIQNQFTGSSILKC